MPQDDEKDDEEDTVVLRECLQRQLDEFEALELIFPSSSSTTISIDHGPRGTVMLALASSTSPLSSLSLPRLTLSVGTSPCLGISLPAYYPELAGTAPTLRWKEGGGRSTHTKDIALRRFEDVCRLYEGAEHLLPLIQDFYAWLEEDEVKAEADKAARQTLHAKGEEEKALPPQRPVIGRRLIYFHHIINKHKREFVIQEALAHGLGGYSKYGWPGVVVVEGEEGQVCAYVRLLQTLRWKEIRVRGEEREVCEEGQEVDELRRLHRGFEELEERELSVLARHLREAGLDDLFGTLMK